VNYAKIYATLIARGRCRKLAGYHEVHHIIPKCMGGSNSADNLVSLTAKEHFITHHLLIKMFPDNRGLKFAFGSMSRSNSKQLRYTPNSYEAVKKANAEALSSLHKGRICSELTRSRMSAAAKVSATVKEKNKPSFNCKNLEILTPSGFRPFDGVAYTGLIPCLEFHLSNGLSVTVSAKHRFDASEKKATEYVIGDCLLTDSGYADITGIVSVGRKQTFDILEVGGGHLFFGNNIAHHNCEFVVDVNRSVVPEATDAHMERITYEVVKPPFYLPTTGIDLGYTDGTGAVFGYYNFKLDKLVIEDELFLARTTSDKIIAETKRIEVLHWGKDRPPPQRIVDGPALAIADMAAVHKFSCRAPDKTDLAANINRLRMFINDERLIINPRCRNLISQLKFAIWKDDSRKTFARDSGGYHFDVLAALMYFCKHVDMSSNPFPAGYGYDPFTDFGYPRDNESSTTSIIRRMFSLNRR